MPTEAKMRCGQREGGLPRNAGVSLASNASASERVRNCWNGDFMDASNPWVFMGRGIESDMRVKMRMPGGRAAQAARTKGLPKSSRPFIAVSGQEQEPSLKHGNRCHGYHRYQLFLTSWDLE